MRRLPPLSALLVAALALLALLTAPAAGAATGGSVRIGVPPSLPADASLAGAAPAAEPLRLFVALQPRDPAALERFATEVSTPGSPNYGNHLSVAEFASRFGATPAQVTTVRSALEARGLEVGPTGANDLSLPVTTTVGAAESAFGLSIDQVELAAGESGLLSDRAPAVPAAAAPFVEAVLGLNHLAPPHRKGSSERSPLSVPAAQPAVTSSAVPGSPNGPQPCTAAIKTREEEGGYTADQISSLYGFSDLYAAGNFGAGQKIALLEFEPFLSSDIETFQDCYGTHVPITKVDIGGGPGPYKGKDDEAALDIEQLVSLAPGASIVVYQGSTESTETEILSTWVQQNVAKVMSSSWGLCEPEYERAEFATIDTLLQEAAAQGQSFFEASGDKGSSDCYDPEAKNFNKAIAIDSPSNQPFTTSVGGTRLESATEEFIWNDDEAEGSAGGGGISEHFPMPAYQLNAAPSLRVINSFSNGETCGFAGYCRQVPDVSAEGDPDTAYIFFTEKHWDQIGGTSAAAPLWAAFAALANASPACAGHSIGFANPALYSIASSAYAVNFKDVISGRFGKRQTNNIFETGGPYPVGAGYDMDTGLGTPRIPALAASLCALAVPAPIPAPPAAAPAPPTTAPVAPKPAPTPAPAPRLTRPSLAGLGRERPALSFALAAQPGAELRSLTIKLPAGLTATDSRATLDAAVHAVGPDGEPLDTTARSKSAAHSIWIRLAAPVDSARFRIGAAAFEVAPGLLERVRDGRADTLKFLVVVRESGGKGSRLPVALNP